jgi:hypothetical protein
MQEHSSKIFGDIIDGLGGFMQLNLTSQMIHSSLMPIKSTSSSSLPTGITNNSSSLLTSGVVAGGHMMHMFTIKNMTLHAEFLPANSHNTPEYQRPSVQTNSIYSEDGMTKIRPGQC